MFFWIRRKCRRRTKQRVEKRSWRERFLQAVAWSRPTTQQPSRHSCLQHRLWPPLLTIPWYKHQAFTITHQLQQPACLPQPASQPFLHHSLQITQLFSILQTTFCKCRKASARRRADSLIFTAKFTTTQEYLTGGNTTKTTRDIMPGLCSFSLKFQNV